MNEIHGLPSDPQEWSAFLNPVCLFRPIWTEASVTQHRICAHRIYVVSSKLVLTAWRANMLQEHIQALTRKEPVRSQITLAAP